METTDNTNKQPGDFIDRYEILSILGEGGMGVVYKAHAPHLDKVVAVKLIRSSVSSANLQLRFQKEAKALKNLRHPSIPEIYDFAVEKNGDPFMIIDFIEGKSLKQHLIPNMQLSPKQALEIIEPLCSTLKYAHEHSIVHRDIKPDNIILAKNDDGSTEVKVIDFGLAHLGAENDDSQDLTKTGNVLGSPKYMSPEQAKGKKATAASDIYSVGCILFEMLAGRPPYQGKTALETISMHVTHNIEDQIPHLPEKLQNSDVAETIKQAMAKDASKRFDSVNSIANRLREYLEDSNRPVIDLPEFEPSGPDGNEIAKISLIGSVATLTIIVIAVLGYKTISKHFDKTDKAKLITDEVITTNQKVPSSGETTKDLLKNTGFHHIPKKREGYYDGAENVTDNDFASLINANPAPTFVTSDKSFTVTGSGVYYLRSMGVQRLNIESPKLTDEVLANAALLPKLFDLTITGTNHLTVDGIKELQKIKELRILNLENLKLKPGMVKELAKLDDLFSFSLKGSKPLTNEDIETLSAMKGLNNLGVSYTDLDPSVLKYLSSFKKLRALKCESLGITDQDLKPLLSIPIESLDISGNNLTEEGLRLLSSNKSIMRLDGFNQNWMNKRDIDEEVMEQKLDTYRKAGIAFKHAIPGRKIRFRFGQKDPCK